MLNIESLPIFLQINLPYLPHDHKTRQSWNVKYKFTILHHNKHVKLKLMCTINKMLAKYGLIIFGIQNLKTFSKPNFNQKRSWCDTVMTKNIRS
jgi:hypothetical protein